MVARNSFMIREGTHTHDAIGWAGKRDPENARAGAIVRRAGVMRRGIQFREARFAANVARRFRTQIEDEGGASFSVTHIFRVACEQGRARVVFFWLEVGFELFVAILYASVWVTEFP